MLSTSAPQLPQTSDRPHAGERAVSASTTSLGAHRLMTKGSISQYVTFTVMPKASGRGDDVRRCATDSESATMDQAEPRVVLIVTSDTDANLLE